MSITRQHCIKMIRMARHRADVYRYLEQYGIDTSEQLSKTARLLREQMRYGDAELVNEAREVLNRLEMMG